MGVGECAGEVARGLLAGVESDAVCDWKGAFACGSVVCEPKTIGGRPFALTGPPFGGKPDAPDALMTTEGLRL